GQRALTRLQRERLRHPQHQHAQPNPGDSQGSQHHPLALLLDGCGQRWRHTVPLWQPRQGREGDGNGRIRGARTAATRYTGHGWQAPFWLVGETRREPATFSHCPATATAPCSVALPCYPELLLAPCPTCPLAAQPSFGH